LSHKNSPFNWEKLRGPRGLTAIIVSTALGAGLFPFAPGTMGTLIAVPLVYFSQDAFWVFRLLLWAALLAIGTWSAKVIDELMGSSDHQNIVIDEVVGFGITAWTAGNHPETLFVAFVVFRFFDILKPPPVRQVDRWSKIKASQKSGTASQWWGGFGVMADDLLAGVLGLLTVMALQHFGLLR